jgi:hypothetical protein
VKGNENTGCAPGGMVDEKMRCYNVGRTFKSDIESKDVFAIQ